MFDPLYAISLGVTVVESSWLAISSDTSVEQLGKDTKWHNITTCCSVDFAFEASTFIWFYLAGMATVAQASVSASMLIEVMLMCSGSLGAG